jgi:hypothetical protein
MQVGAWLTPGPPVGVPGTSVDQIAFQALLAEVLPMDTKYSTANDFNEFDWRTSIGRAIKRLRFTTKR